MADEISMKKSWKGMPKGIPFIVGNEAAERFSYYGMKAILTVFMVQYLRLPENQATEWYHNFGTAVYFLPIIGALLSDLVLGKYRTILFLSMVYCGGHLVLALNETKDGLLWGLTLIAIGSGGIKPCVSAHVGDQFGERNKHLINTIFNIFYFAINFGSFFSTLLTPILLEIYGPAVAFGLPGALMFLATFVFWLGRREYIHVPARPHMFLEELFSDRFLKTVLRLGLVYLFISIFWALYDQTGSSWLIQSQSKLMDKNVSLFFWEFEILPSQINTINPILVMIMVPIFTFVLYPFINRFFELKALHKIFLGMLFCAWSFYIIGGIEEKIHNGESVHVYTQFWAYVVLTAGEVLLSLTALEYSYTQSPVSMKSVVMSLFLMSVSLGNFTASQVNKYLIDKPIVVNGFESKQSLVIETNENLETRDKININEDLGLELIDEKNETRPLTGTFKVEKISGNKFKVLDINMEELKIKEKVGFSEKRIEFKNAFSTYNMRGAEYFNFFALMMLITSVVFLPFSFILKERIYLQA